MKDKRKTLRRKADRLFQEIIVKLHPYCESCSKPTTVGHHFIPKSLSNSLRYEIINGIGLDNGCHFAWHTKSDPVIYERIIEKRGNEWLAKIRQIREKEVKVTVGWYREQIAKLEKIKETI